jgi:hypothetical protein
LRGGDGGQRRRGEDEAGDQSCRALHNTPVKGQRGPIGVGLDTGQY